MDSLIPYMQLHHGETALEVTKSGRTFSAARRNRIWHPSDFNTTNIISFKHTDFKTLLCMYMQLRHGEIALDVKRGRGREPVPCSVSSRIVPASKLSLPRRNSSSFQSSYQSIRYEWGRVDHKQTPSSLPTQDYSCIKILPPALLLQFVLVSVSYKSAKYTSHILPAAAGIFLHQNSPSHAATLVHSSVGFLSAKYTYHILKTLPHYSCFYNIYHLKRQP